jgi:hypothetical protein
MPDYIAIIADPETKKPKSVGIYAADIGDAEREAQKLAGGGIVVSVGRKGNHAETANLDKNPWPSVKF